MKLLIDADGCPVVDCALRLCRARGVPVLILCDTSHRIERSGAVTIVVDQGADSVDFALVNRAEKGDLVITQDYGLAGMCLARGARVLNQNGLVYTDDNIGPLLDARYLTKKTLRAGGRVRGPAKRTPAQEAAFAAALSALLPPAP